MAVTKEEVEAARHDPKQANILYHDWEATTYDEKWSISFDDRCTVYAKERFTSIAGEDGWPYETALEIGSGTGFFLLNLMRAGVATSGIVTDISPGMVEVATRNAKELGFDVTGRVADAETIPVEDSSVDLVVGHAVLHHIPDVDQAFAEVLRVLKPGGRFVFAGEPTKYGDVIARKLSQLTWWATTNATRLPVLADWRRPQQELDASSEAAALEAVVDLHTFDPHSLAVRAVRAGAQDVSVKTEEFTAAWFGWPVRTFECAVPSGKLGWNWAMFAYKGWLALSAVDKHVFSQVIPKELFYNLLITGTKPL
ncbi:class I SAM-dependent methyltransferase [Fodinicola feengrottensis]|uniref:Class I SAM-dependent methyltransferase n=1 Tax=Fodinicola feengrottensis TaxID=435914 RepID=A0ABP4RT34_9ACTN